MDVACHSCSSRSTIRVGAIRPALVFAGHTLSELLDGGALYRCSDCALAFRHPAPAPETLDALYRTGSLDHWQYHAEKRTDWIITRKWLGAHSEGRTLLDVGCFDGAFAEFMGPSWTSQGIEINESAVQIASGRGVEVVGRNVSELAGLKQRYHAVVAFDVIEHVPDPAALLADMRDVTMPGGYIVVASGNADASSWQLMGSNYWYCTIPEHLAFVGRTWCELIAPRLGLSLVYASTFSHAQDRTLKLTLHELASNVLYRLFPGVFASLRRLGLGDKDVSRHREMAYFPPTWISAKDHIIAIFQKA